MAAGAACARDRKDLPLELRLEGQEAGIQRSLPGRAQEINIELVLAPGLIQTGLRVHLNSLSSLRQRLARGQFPPHDAAHRGLGVLESEIDVARGRARNIRELPFDPQVLERLIVVEQGADVAVKSRHRPHEGGDQWQLFHEGPTPCRASQPGPLLASGSGRATPEARNGFQGSALAAPRQRAPGPSSILLWMPKWPPSFELGSGRLAEGNRRQAGWLGKIPARRRPGRPARDPLKREA